MIKLLHGKSEEILKTFEDNSIDSIVTDPPYGIGFMGKDWDKALPPIEVWKECIRILKPGGYIVAMSASRTYHRLAVQLEDLGMTCHPMIGWLYGSGFPKATDLSKQFDKQAGVERVKIREKYFAKKTLGSMNDDGWKPKPVFEEIPSTDNAKKWDGYKYGLQALKPALEPIAVFQKPWKCKEVKRMTDNIVKHGVGAFNIDACRVRTSEIKENNSTTKTQSTFNKSKLGFGRMTGNGTSNQLGRHPANLLHDGSESVEEHFPDAKGPGNVKPAISQESENNCMTGKNYKRVCNLQKYHGQDGSVSRFFNKLPFQELDAPFLYNPKPSKKEKNAGLENMRQTECGIGDDRPSGQSMSRLDGRPARVTQNSHPTVKPIKLMEWLIKLVTPEGGTTLDPFLGSGTSGIAAKINGFNFIGVERELDNFEIASQRIENAN